MLDVAVLLSIGRHPASGRARPADLDARALQVALSLADGARVHAIHAGDPNEPALRDYLGMGIDCLAVVASEGDVSKSLIDYLAQLRPAVVLAGRRAEWGEASGMLPYLVAHTLGSQMISYGVSITLRGDSARVIQATPRGGRRALRVTLPLTLTVDRTGPEPRMSAFGPARRGRIELVAMDPTLGLPAIPDDWRERPARARPRRLPAIQGSAAERLRSIQSPRAGSGTRLIGTDPVQAAQAIWQYLVQEGLAEAGAPPGGSSRTAETEGSG
jgi:N,N-dimethylglycine/sarcosine catabolism electron transfer flavoprotein subunit beta